MRFISLVVNLQDLHLIEEPTEREPAWSWSILGRLKGGPHIALEWEGVFSNHISTRVPGVGQSKWQRGCHVSSTLESWSWEKGLNFNGQKSWACQQLGAKEEWCDFHPVRRDRQPTDLEGKVQMGCTRQGSPRLHAGMSTSSRRSWVPLTAERCAFCWHLQTCAGMDLVFHPRGHGHGGQGDLMCVSRTWTFSSLVSSALEQGLRWKHHKSCTYIPISLLTLMC